MTDNALEKPIIQRELEALRLAFADAVHEHAQAGVPVVVWKDGKVMTVLPEELLPEGDTQLALVPGSESS